MIDFFDKLKEQLKDIHPVYVVVGGAAFTIYLLEAHIFLAGFVFFSLGVTFFFKKWGVLVLSILADFADYAGAAVPIAGDFLDIFIIIIQAAKYGAQGFVGLLELIPFADLFPIMAINAGFAEYRRKYRVDNPK
ncbi:MAG: hypothetical protein HOP34_08830 [Methylococcaceae bacterium]|nr:hypothetical protein [Methylococcaceae bacterium]